MGVTNDETVTQTDTPPRRRRRSPSTATESGSQAKGAAAPSSEPPPRPTAGGRSLQTRLEEFFGALALPYATIGDEYAAKLIAERAPKLAESWADLAKQNKGVERFLNGLLQGTAWGGVLLSSASLAIPLLAHHGILPVPIDPFAAMYGSDPTVPVRGRGPAAVMPDWGHPPPIVPDPPDTDDMTPPIGAGQPSGTFTVAGSANGAVQVDE